MVTSFAIIILVIQTCIVYDTYPLMEHMTNEQGLVILGNSVAKFYEQDDKSNKLINLNPSNPLGNAYAGAHTLMDHQTGRHKDDTDMLNAVNNVTGKTYKFDSLPKNPFFMNTFNQDQIGNMITKMGNIYLNALDQVIIDTTPIHRP